MAKPKKKKKKKKRKKKRKKKEKRKKKRKKIQKKKNMALFWGGLHVARAGNVYKLYLSQTTL